MGWCDGTVGGLVTLQRGHDLTDADREDGDVPVVGAAGPNGFHSKPKARGPGVVIGRSGGSIGKVTYVPSEFWPHNTCLYVRDFKGNDPRFVAYLLSTLNLAKLNSGAAQPSLNRNFVHPVCIRFPGPEEQRSIAGILSAYDDLIENNRRRIQLLEAAARLLYKEWFVHLRFPGHEHVKITNGLPEGWERRPLGGCAKFLSGGTPSKSRPEFWDGNIPWVSSGELTCMRVHRTSLNVTGEAVEAGSRLVPRDTILAVVRGMSLAKEFRIGITGREVAFNQDIKALAAQSDVDPLFLFHALDTQRDEIRQRATDASHGTKKLDTPVLAEVPIPVPAPTLQALFRQHIEPIHAQWDNLDLQNEKLRTARDLLLPRLMNGEIRL